LNCGRYTVSSTRISRRVNAPRTKVYRALLDPGAVAKWRVPTGMTSHVHDFDAREGGLFRISHLQPADRNRQNDSAHGHVPRPLCEARPERTSFEVTEFETNDPALCGEMTITTTLVMRTAAPMLSPCTKGYRPGCRPQTTKLAGGKHSRDSRRSSKRIERTPNVDSCAECAHTEVMRTPNVSGRVPAKYERLVETGACRSDVQERSRGTGRDRKEPGNGVPRISFRASLSGRAYLPGHRVAVWEVLAVHEEAKSIERTASHFGWPRVLVKRTLAYAKAFPDEISGGRDAEIER
jgi:uncharacterized protein (DUF433 family)